jgi:ATP-dependent Lon protease
MNVTANDALVGSMFEGRLVRKDLVLQLKGAFNVPIYVLEFLLGRYCSSNDIDAIRDGLDLVRDYLTRHYARPDEAETIKYKAKERGSFTIIDKLIVHLNDAEDQYLGELASLNIKNVFVEKSLLDAHPMVIGDGVWAEIELGYDGTRTHGKKIRPFFVVDLKPIQLTRFRIDEFVDARKLINRDAWIRLLLRSIGIEPDYFDDRTRMLLLSRLIPFVENNYNAVELGPRGTGKSFVYEQISPYATLVSGGKASVAQLFVNNTTGKMGLVGLWDVVAFDEVAGMRLEDSDAIQIFKGYMESGMFSRGKHQLSAQGSIVYLGNINFDVHTSGRARHFFEPFPEAMQDLAFLDRVHAYVPGWEIPKMKPEFFTREYGLMVDYFAAFLRESRKTSYVDLLEKRFRFGSSLNARDAKAVKKTVSGYVKLLHPGGDPSDAEIAEYLHLAIEGRRRVKEQLRKMGGVEYHATNLSYIDNETGIETIVNVREANSSSLIPAAQLEPGVVFAANYEKATEKVAIYRLEAISGTGSGKMILVTQGGGSIKQGFDIASGFVRKHAGEMFANTNLREIDLSLQPNPLTNATGEADIAMGMAVAMSSAITGIPALAGLIVLGGLTLQGVPLHVEAFADVLQVIAEAGARRVLVPVENRREVALVPSEILDKIDLIFYGDPKSGVNKALAHID